MYIDFQMLNQPCIPQITCLLMVCYSFYVLLKTFDLKKNDACVQYVCVQYVCVCVCRRCLCVSVLVLLSESERQHQHPPVLREASRSEHHNLLCLFG